MDCFWYCLSSSTVNSTDITCLFHLEYGLGQKSPAVSWWFKQMNDRLFLFRARKLFAYSAAQISADTTSPFCLSNHTDPKFRDSESFPLSYRKHNNNKQTNKHNRPHPLLRGGRDSKSNLRVKLCCSCREWR